jgi:hypothetical protein
LGGGEGSCERVPARTSCRMLSQGTILRSMVVFGDGEVKTWAKMMSRSSWGMVRRVGGIALGGERGSGDRVDVVWAADCIVWSFLDGC